MKKIHVMFMTVMIAFTVSLAGINDAEARRLGGGSSFGSKSRYSMPYKRSTTNTANRSASQQQTSQRNQAARQSMSKRGGLMGMLGALAIGGLLGSLFFGGAFEGLNFMDILIFGAIAYLLYRMFAAKAGQTQQSTAYQRSGHDDFRQADQFREMPSSNEPSQAGFNTDLMFGKGKPDAQNMAESGQQNIDVTPSVMPADFDETSFLSGAENAFRQLQNAWDRRDLAEIRGLTTDKVFAEIQEQLQSSDQENQTDVLKLNAELLDVREIGLELEAVVLFDSIIRENPQDQAEQIREVWHFVKSKNSRQPTWFLDGIQQLED